MKREASAPWLLPPRNNMASARLKASLGGAADQRDTAYTELAALADGGDAPADAATGLSNATLHIGGLEGEAAEDKVKLAERLSTFGTVLAVTLRREAGESPWALVTYAAAAEMEAALEGAAAELGVESVAVRRLDTQQALANDEHALREALDKHARVVVAASCVAPLIESVLCKDVSEVGAEEFQRASLVLAKLCHMDRQVRPEDRLFSLSSD